MAKSSAPKKKEDDSAKKEKPKKQNSMLLIFLIVVVAAGSVAGAYFFFSSGKDTKKSSKAAEADAKKTVSAENVTTMELGDMVVNLAGDSGGRYLRLKIVIEHPKESKITQELKDKTPLIKDTLITTLRSKTAAEVTPPTATETLKKSLIKEINNNLEYGDITNLYFTDFMLQ